MSRAPKESRFGKEIQAHMEGVLAQHFAAQRLRLRQSWEPRVVSELSAVADECGLLLDEVAGEYAEAPLPRRSPGAMRLRLSLEFMKIARQRAERARGLLDEMALAEAEARAGALTANGMLGSVPRLQDSPLAVGNLNRLSHGPVLERAVIQGCHRFTRKVMAYLNLAELDQDSLCEARRHFDSLLRTWRGQLATVARTILYSAADNAKQAVSQSLQ